MSGVSVRQAFLALFGQPGWVRTLLMGTACMLVPVAGQIVIQGYGARILKHVALEQDGPLPPFEGFADHLRQGMLPFLAALIWSLPITLLSYGAAIAAVAAGAGIMFAVLALLQTSGVDPETTGVVAIGSGAVLGTLVLAAGLAVTVMLARLWLAADTLVEITGRIEHAWRPGPIRSYLKVLGREGKLVFPRMILGNLVVVACGTLLCGLGVVFAPFVMLHASAHIQGQLYRLYLERGGEPLHVQVSTRWTSSSSCPARP